VGEPPSPEEIERRRAAARVTEREEKLAELQVQSGDLLAAIKTECLVVVDDQAYPVTTYLQGLQVAEQDELDEIGADEGDPDEPPDARERRITKLWSELPPERREELCERARSLLLKADAGRPLTDLEWLVAMFPPGAVMLVEPGVWRDKSGELTAGEAPPLVLFDQHLAGHEQTGLDLLKEYREAASGDLDPPAGIISNEVDEDGQLRGAPEEGPPEVPSGSLVMISKDHLQEDRLDEALGLLRLTANLPHLSSARDHVVAGLTADVETAAKKLATMSPRVLEDLVYRSSAIEGAWEGETMARVVRLLVTQSTRDREAGDDDLKAVIRRARLLSEHAPSKDDRSVAIAEQLQRTENYVAGEWVNALQLPLANGDIFAFGDGDASAYYVLAAQPCDLVLRADGKREAQAGALLPIVEKRNPKPTLLTEPLPTKPPTPLPESAEVQLKKGLVVSLEVLDLCWFAATGTTKIDDVDVMGTEPMLTEGMNERRRWLTERAREALVELNAAEDETSLHQLLLERLSSGPARVQHDRSAPQRWAFPLRRVARLAHPQAEALLVRYSAAQARAAFDHDLTTLDT
jgi:hypothetical protein